MNTLKTHILAPLLILLFGMFFNLLYAQDEAGGNSSTAITTVTDIDNHTYRVIRINTQNWMAENLRTGHYNDGTPIPNVTGNDGWYDMTEGAWASYKNASEHDNTYGRLYNWYAVSTGKLCPKGWHIPTESDWQVLAEYLVNHLNSDFSAEESAGRNFLSEILGGYRAYNGDFRGQNQTGFWWSSEEISKTHAAYKQLRKGSNRLGGITNHKKYGLSCLCVQD